MIISKLQGGLGNLGRVAGNEFCGIQADPATQGGALPSQNPGPGILQPPLHR